MTQITKAEDMIGRTIKGANVASWRVILNLGDGDYVYIDPAGDYEGGAMLEFDEVPSAHELHSAGVLSEEEYVAAEAERARIRDENIKATELATLKKLREKYPEAADEV